MSSWKAWVRLGVDFFFAKKKTGRKKNRKSTSSKFDDSERYFGFYFAKWKPTFTVGLSHAKSPHPNLCYFLLKFKKKNHFLGFLLILAEMVCRSLSPPFLSHILTKGWGGGVSVIPTVTKKSYQHGHEGIGFFFLAYPFFPRMRG